MFCEHPEDALPDDFTDALLTRAEASAYLAGIGVRRTAATLAKLCSSGDDGPPCLHHGRTPLYAKRALHEWGVRQLSKVRRSPRKRAAPISQPRVRSAGGLPYE